MKQHERTLQELQDYTKKIGGGLQILFAGHHPTIRDGVPHPWQCLLGNHRERYHGYGVTMESAILRCYERWSNQIEGDDFEVTPVANVSIKEWFEEVAVRPLVDARLERLLEVEAE